MTYNMVARLCLRTYSTMLSISTCLCFCGPRLCPLDNAGSFLRELAHMVRPAWVLFGTVAGGSGVYGLMQSGIPVVALARNEEHVSVVKAALRKRLAADLCSSHWWPVIC